jgi:tricorn protease
LVAPVLLLAAVLASALLLAALGPPAAAQAPVRGYYRFPTVHGDQVAFTSEGDLWVVPLAGGEARRLTSHEGQEYFAQFSPDGRWLAFTGVYEGNDDVYVMPAEGGVPTRLTFHPDPDIVVTWTRDSKQVVFRSSRDNGLGDARLWVVPVAGGDEKRLLPVTAGEATLSPDGKRIAFVREFLEARNWKRYMGGRQQDIWVGDLDKKQFTKVTDWGGKDAMPMWMDDGSIVFMSDRDGVVNLWRMQPDGSHVEQLTFHDDYDVRFPSSDGRRVVYQIGGDLWTWSPTEKPHAIAVTLPSDRAYTRVKRVEGLKFVNGWDLSPDGGRLAFTARGEVFAVTTDKEGGRIANLSRTAAREWAPVWSPDGKSVLTLSDRSGEMELVELAADGKGEGHALTSDGKGYRYTPRYSPDGKKVAFADKFMDLWVLDLATRKPTRVAHGIYEEPRDFAWSPDSRWIAYSDLLTNLNHQVHVWDSRTDASQAVTDSFWNSLDVAWDPDGRYLFFVSDRTFDPVTAAPDLVANYINVSKPFLVSLRAGKRSPFEPPVEEAAAAEKEEKAGAGEKAAGAKAAAGAKGAAGEKGEKAEKKAALKDVAIDFAGIRERAVEFPVEPGNYFGVWATADRVFYLTAPTEGLLEGGGDTPEERPRNTLHAFAWKDKKDKVLIEGINDYVVSQDQKKLAVRVKDQFTVTAADADEVTAGKEKVKIEDFRVEVDPKAEWQQMFDEAWRLERDFMYAPNLHGVDWAAMRTKYGRLVPRVATREELSDLFSDMLGELSVSHEYVIGGELRDVKRYRVGALGADFERDAASGLYRVAHVCAGDTWTAGESSPLARPGVDVKVGDYLIAVDNEPLRAGENLYARFQDKAGKFVLLTVNSRPTAAGARDVTVKPVGSEFSLRYLDWVAANRRKVDEATQGRVGYVHIPDMDGAGLKEFSRTYYPQFAKAALIVDARHNRGGWIHWEIVDRLLRKMTALEVAREQRTPQPWPWRATRGHLVFLIDERTGSDGENFADAVKQMNLGTIIGTRTWGGLVGIDLAKWLVDGGTVSQAGYASYAPNGSGWRVEGHGFDPDRVVDLDPTSQARGQDPQLEAAIQEALAELAKDPRDYPRLPQYPDKSLPEWRKKHPPK